jgi:hypothetical protein
MKGEPSREEHPRYKEIDEWEVLGSAGELEQSSVLVVVSRMINPAEEEEGDEEEEGWDEARGAA